MKVLASVIGAIGAITYVGYFAYSVNELPLTVIVTFSLLLMVYSFYTDLRQDRAVAQARRDMGDS